MDDKRSGSRKTASRTQTPEAVAPKPASAGAESPATDFAIAGIGASAGGLAALKQMFQHVKPDSGLAYVVVMHLSPEHESHLDQLLQPSAKMRVVQVRDTVALEPNTVYVIPPNANLETIDTHLRLSALEPMRQDRAPIDHFFRTLADTHDGQSIGVVLTGTGSDGTLGLLRIRERGGLTIAQDPAESEYDGMPRSAVSTGAVDMVLPLARIPDAIVRFSQTKPRVLVPRDEEDPDRDARQLLSRVFAHVRTQSGRDFSHYKRSTLLRRITRRMQFNHIQDSSAYVEFLRDHADEAQALADDLLVTVTSFFRDPEVFETLQKDVIPELFVGKTGTDSVRVWSVGCATGEEAYSLAMLLLEEAGRHRDPPTIHIFASDLHPRSLAKAREGFYAGDIEADVGAARLARFFRHENGGYRLRNEVRELVIFAPHNVLSDPPFSRLDLISCRNLLIYLERGLHRQIAELFHYALQPDGILVLGTSETTDTAELFRIEDKRRGVYRRRNVPGPEPRLPVFPLTRGRFPHGPGRGSIADNSPMPASYGLMHQRIVELHGPPSVLVSPDDNVVHISAHAGRYLGHPGGAPTTGVLKLVREELRVELQSVLRASRSQRRNVRSRAVQVRINGELFPVVLDVRPALEPDKEGFLLLIFDEQSPVTEATSPDREANAALVTSLPRMRELEAEKLLAEQRLQAVVEEYETSQEEIRASNEELQSANEELRSTLEELETSKEELQSMNEELQTVNQENRHKVEELGQLSDDLQNLLSATDIATLFLDRELRILRFTPKIGELFNMRMTDPGRPISDLTHRLGYQTLQADARAVLAKLVPVEKEVEDESGRWYLTRVLPYRNADDRIAGVVVTFVEITRQKRAEDQVRRAKERSERILEALPEPLLVLSADCKVQSANAAFYEHFRVEPAHTVGRTVYDLGNGQWNIPALRGLLDGVLAKRMLFSSYQVEHTFEGLGRRVMLLNGRLLDDRELILLGIQDITLRYESEQAVRRSELQLAAELAGMRRLHDLVGRLLECTDVHKAMEEVLLAAIEITGADQGHVQLVNVAGDALEIVAQSGFEAPFLARFKSVSMDEDTACGRAWRTKERTIISDVDTDAGYTPFRADAAAAGYRAVQSSPLLSREDDLLGVLSTHYKQPRQLSERDLHLLDLCARQASDFVDRIRADEALRTSRAQLGEENRRKDEYLAMLGHELRNPLAAIRSATEILQEAVSHSPDSGLQRVSDALERQSGHVSRIIDGLLEVSRIARGKVSLVLAPLDVSALLARVLDDNVALFDERKLILHRELNAGSLWVQGDSNRLIQVFDNLIGNAIKFTPAGGSVTVSTALSEGMAEIKIRDTGVGIRPEMLALVFEVFQQETQDVARSTGGLGLGLALATGLVNLHGGTLEAHSDGPGHGSKFVVQLPWTQAKPPTPRDHELPNVGPKRILVVEDNSDAAEMLGELLVRRGHDVAIAETGTDALVSLRGRAVDLVFCDLGLPGMSGYDLARAIRQDSKLRATPLVALSGYGQPEDRARAIEAGFDAHLVKPAGMAALDEVIVSLTAATS